MHKNAGLKQDFRKSYMPESKKETNTPMIT